MSFKVYNERVINDRQNLLLALDMVNLFELNDRALLKAFKGHGFSFIPIISVLY
jgi:hypothetical protein